MYKSGVEPLVLNWNRVAMEYLREDKFSESLRLLQKAEELLKYPDGTDPSKLLAITYNNLGCYYKKTQKYQIALKYFIRAQDIEVTSVADKTNLAGTHLNICSVYSSMKQHEKALTHGILAVKFLKEANESEKNSGTMISLIIALHNTGFEYEVLKEKDNALNTYKCGLDLATKHLGTDHQITTALFKSYSNLISSFNYKTAKVKKVNLPKRKSQALPNINSLATRNRSVGSRGKIVRSVYEKGGCRTNSNKTFTENCEEKRNLPAIDKPRTVAKRQRRVLKDEKVAGLEEKIAELQNQISMFQVKYKNLEAQVGRKLSKHQAAIIIQRAYRAYLKHRGFYLQNKARVVLKELEMLKKQMPSEGKKNVYSAVYRNKESVEPVHVKTGYLRTQRPIKIPLDPIRESKLETKEMKATLIQSCVRMFLARKRYKEVKSASVKIQKTFKAYQCRKLFLDIRLAVVCIQRFWRSKLKQFQVNL